MPKKYYIKKGDTLTIIAQKLGVSIDYLMEMNPQFGDIHSEKDYLYY